MKEDNRNTYKYQWAFYVQVIGVIILLLMLSRVDEIFIVIGFGMALILLTIISFNCFKIVFDKDGIIIHFLVGRRIIYNIQNLKKIEVEMVKVAMPLFGSKRIIRMYLKDGNLYKHNIYPIVSKAFLGGLEKFCGSKNIECVIERPDHML